MFKVPSDSGASIPGIAVMVPDDHIDEAHLLIESEGSYNDYYDVALHDDYEDDYDEF